LIFENQDPAHLRRQIIGNSEITVGRFTYGLEGLSVREWGEGASLSIGAFCSIAEGAQVFLGGNHRADWISTFPFGHIYQDHLVGEAPAGHPATNGPVAIGNCVWIGSNATIMSGVSISDGAVIAANATVTKDVGPYEIVGGSPAKLIRKRFDDVIIGKLLELAWWNLDTDQINEITSALCSPPDIDMLESLILKYRHQD
jgi:acetyltransferase-like isoleucine patch superfamily enzyme